MDFRVLMLRSWMPVCLIIVLLSAVLLSMRLLLTPLLEICVLDSENVLLMSIHSCWMELQMTVLISELSSSYRSNVYWQKKSWMNIKKSRTISLYRSSQLSSYSLYSWSGLTIRIPKSCTNGIKTTQLLLTTAWRLRSDENSISTSSSTCIRKVYKTLTKLLTITILSTMHLRSIWNEN